MSAGTFSVRLGVDLKLVCETSREGYAIRAMTADGNVLETIGTSAAAPSDAIIGAARATAIALFPEHVTMTAEQRVKLAEQPALVEVKPHRFDRDRPTWNCKICPFDGHHKIHQNIPPATRQS